MELYECKKLHARISKKSCEQNRNKGVESKPIQCEKCIDYLSWGEEPQEAKKKGFVCPDCGKETKYYAKGLCSTCYCKIKARERERKGSEDNIKIKEVNIEIKEEIKNNLIPIEEMLDLLCLYSSEVKTYKELYEKTKQEILQLCR